jgi:hypothetical protein
MKANPGGQIAVEEVVGRDQLIQTLWDTLEGTSVIMTAERRIGKTSIIRKMCAQPRGNWVPVFQDLERVHSANEFAETVYDAIHQFLSRMQKVANRARRLWQAIGGAEVAGVLKLPESKEAHWKHLLTHAVADLVEEQAPRRLVFFWDEMPYMLLAIARNEGEKTAMEVLDVLRYLRQTHAAFRMVLTGSIGLHHVLTTLKDAGHTNEPVNDMCAVEVPSLAAPDAQGLARQLIEGEQLATANLEEAARTVATQGDRFPFYVHFIVRHLKVSGRRADPGPITEAVTEQMTAANDPWQLAHYRTRIKSFYPGEEKVVLAVLDFLAPASEPQPVAAILSAVKAQTTFDDRERLLELLKLMQRDHYLTRTPDGRFAFRFPLISRWWKLDRGL